MPNVCRRGQFVALAASRSVTMEFITTARYIVTGSARISLEIGASATWFHVAVLSTLRNGEL